MIFFLLLDLNQDLFKSGFKSINHASKYIMADVT